MNQPENDKIQWIYYAVQMVKEYLQISSIFIRKDIIRLMHIKQLNV